MGKLRKSLKQAFQERMDRVRQEAEKKGEYSFVAKASEDSRVDPRVVAFHQKRSPVAEQYRMIRTAIQALRAKTPLSVIGVTSAVNGEGKTLTSLNLAVTLASELKRNSVLLIDGDMRKGSLSRYMGLESNAGLADAILSKEPGKIVCETEIPDLCILPSGSIPPNPAELLGSDEFRSMVNIFKEQYHYVIIDTPPALPLTDAGLIASACDGMIFVVKAGATQRGTLNHAAGMVRQAGGKVLGYILTDIRYHVPAYMYRYL